MAEEQNIYPLLDLIFKIIVFVSRPVVQVQLLAIALGIEKDTLKPFGIGLDFDRGASGILDTVIDA